jgi:membrane-associated phospholipid phosphatase
VWAKAIEAARTHAVAASLCCWAGLAVLVLLAYEVGPVERLDADVLRALNSPEGTLANEVAFAAEQLVAPLAWVVAAALAFLLALAQDRPRRGLFAATLIGATAVVDLTLKVVLEHPRFQPVPGEPFDWYPVAKAFPSGNSAGALAIALAFLYVVPLSWRRPTAAIGAVFTLAVSLGLPVLNYHYPGDVLGGWLVAAGCFFALLAVPWFRAGPPPPPRARPWRFSGRSPYDDRRSG